jgi:hypothetical protein
VNQAWAGHLGSLVASSPAGVDYEYCDWEDNTCTLPSWQVRGPNKCALGGEASALRSLTTHCG